MNFHIDRETNRVSRQEFERLFAEAFDYLSAERQRLGDNLKEDLWLALRHEGSFIHRYMVDDYLVGVASLIELLIPYQGKVERWAHYIPRPTGRHKVAPAAGGTQKSFKKQARQFCDEENFDRLLVVHNPTSPAALAVTATWGREWDGRKYFETPEVKTLDETFGDARRAFGYPDTMRCFVMGKAS